MHDKEYDRMFEYGGEFLEIESLITSMWYSYNTGKLIDLLKEVKERMEGVFPCQQWSLMGNILYGFIIQQYGDYGISPRSGWINDSIIKIKLIDYFGLLIEHYKELESEDN